MGDSSISRNAPASASLRGTSFKQKSGPGSGASSSSSFSFMAGTNPLNSFQSVEHRVRLLEYQITTCLESQRLMYEVFNKYWNLEERVKGLEEQKDSTPEGIETDVGFDEYDPDPTDPDRTGGNDNEYYEEEGDDMPMDMSQDSTKDHDEAAEGNCDGRKNRIGTPNIQEQDQNGLTRDEDLQEGEFGESDEEPNTNVDQAKIECKLCPASSSRAGAQTRASYSTYQGLAEHYSSQHDIPLVVDGSPKHESKSKTKKNGNDTSGLHRQKTKKKIKKLPEKLKAPITSPESTWEQVSSPSEPSNTTGDESDDNGAKWREELLVKQKELVVLQQRKLELELQQIEQARLKASVGKGKEENAKLLKQAEIAKQGTSMATSIIAKTSETKAVSTSTIRTDSPTVREKASSHIAGSSKSSYPKISSPPKEESTAANTSNIGGDPRLRKTRVSLVKAGLRTQKHLVVGHSTSSKTNSIKIKTKIRCTECGKECRKASWKHHMLKHSAPGFRCDSCGRMFRWQYSLTRHKFLVHGLGQIGTAGARRSSDGSRVPKGKSNGRLAPPASFSCPESVCNQTFSSRWALKKHVLSHSSLLSTHPKIERRGRPRKTKPDGKSLPWPCRLEGCGLSFPFRSVMLRHRSKCEGKNLDPKKE